MELLIDTRRDREREGEIGADETAFCKTGDVICAKLDGAPWGKEERRLYVVVRVDGQSNPAFAEVERKLQEQADRGEPYPHVDLPFRETETVTEDHPTRDTQIERERTTNPSGYRFRPSRWPKSGPHQRPDKRPNRPLTPRQKGKKAFTDSDFRHDPGNRRDPQGGGMIGGIGHG